MWEMSITCPPQRLWIRLGLTTQPQVPAMGEKKRAEARFHLLRKTLD
jgi:hypothetical protein